MTKTTSAPRLLARSAEDCHVLQSFLCAGAVNLSSLVFQKDKQVFSLLLSPLLSLEENQEPSFELQQPYLFLAQNIEQMSVERWPPEQYTVIAPQNPKASDQALLIKHFYFIEQNNFTGLIFTFFSNSRLKLTCTQPNIFFQPLDS